MLVSVIVPTYKMQNYGNLVDAIDSLLNQSYTHIEVIVAIHTSKQLYERIAKAYTKQGKVKVLFNEQSLGAAAARNVGTIAARGAILAFIDDDAVADKRWIENLVNTYQEFNAMAVGGKILPIWEPSKPAYFPEELYWLVGVTYRGFAEEKVVEVRNALGPNMSFKKEVFEQVGLFNENMGLIKKGTFYIQAEETEFSLRMTGKFGVGVIYNPDAIVHHKIPASKARLRLMLRRSFYQGYSKVLLQKLTPSQNSISIEKSYLKDLVLKYIPQRIRMVFTGPSRATQLKQLSVLACCITAAGLGFVHGRMRQIK